jgi:2-polyprenyl-3-methyl-5-hydroxy-6-metoxy-1,4-benzoquinol methylase
MNLGTTTLALIEDADSHALLEWPVSDLCGSSRPRVVYEELTDERHHLPGRFGIVRCEACGLLYLAPRPVAAHLADYYPPDYACHQCDPDSSELAHVRLSMRKRARRALVGGAERLYQRRYGESSRIVPPFGGGRLLDVGCGPGEFLASMQRAGWDVYGVEPSAAASDRARLLVGAQRIITGSMDGEAAAELPPMDLITMHHVLEHVVEPRGTLRAITRCLRANGQLRVQVPNVGSVEARLFGRDWWGLDVPRHLWHFSRVTLTRLLAEEGFIVEHWRPQWSPDVAVRSVERMLDRRFGWEIDSRASRVVRMGVTPIAALANALGSSGAIEVLCRRDPVG